MAVVTEGEGWKLWGGYRVFLFKICGKKIVLALGRGSFAEDGVEGGEGGSYQVVAEMAACCAS